MNTHVLHPTATLDAPAPAKRAWRVLRYWALFVVDFLNFVAIG